MKPWLAALLLSAGCHAKLDDAGDGGGVDLARSPDLANGDWIETTGDGGASVVRLNLLGGWSFIYDAESSQLPEASVIVNTSDAVSARFSDGGCACSAEHRVFTLPRPMPCDATVLSFDWGVAEVYSLEGMSALRVDFNPGGDIYDGDDGQFIASTWTGTSACAFHINNMYPSPARLRRGHNDVALKDLAIDVDGRCTHGATFTSIDIHLEGYSCAQVPAQPPPTVTANLSNVELR